MQRPAADEYATPFRAYIDRVPDGDVFAQLEQQGAATQRRIARLDESVGSFAYAAGKWSVKRVLQHVVDGERLFCYRALCLARGDQQELPGFEEDVYAANDGSDGRLLRDIGDEWAAVRAATMQLFRGFDGAAWGRRGIANGNPVSVRSVPWLIAGHELHHWAVLTERYRLA